jgi:hypothetical protein
MTYLSLLPLPPDLLLSNGDAVAEQLDAVKQ